MTWKDCVAALQAGVDPNALLAYDVEESARTLNPPPVPATASLYQRLHEADDGERTFQLVFLRPLISFWEDTHASEFGISEGRGAVQVYDEEELTFHLSDAFRFLIVDPPDFACQSGPHEVTTACLQGGRDIADTNTLRTLHENNSEEADVCDAPASKWAFNLEEAVEAVRELASPNSSSERAASAKSIGASLSVFEWSLVSQTLRERELHFLEDKATLIRVAETVHSTAVGEWILFGLSETPHGASEWLSEAEHDAAGLDAARLASTASQCLRSWTWASLKRKLKPFRVCGEGSESVLSSFAVCRALHEL